MPKSKLLDRRDISDELELYPPDEEDPQWMKSEWQEQYDHLEETINFASRECNIPLRLTTSYGRFKVTNEQGSRDHSPNTTPLKLDYWIDGFRKACELKK